MFVTESGPAAGAPQGPPQCSAKGCRRAATTDLSWRNPRLHDAARVKHWLACDEHAETLGSFLRVRGFLLASGPFEASPPDG